MDLSLEHNMNPHSTMCIVNTSNTWGVNPGMKLVSNQFQPQICSGMHLFLVFTIASIHNSLLLQSHLFTGTHPPPPHSLSTRPELLT